MANRRRRPFAEIGNPNATTCLNSWRREPISNWLPEPFWKMSRPRPRRIFQPLSARDGSWIFLVELHVEVDPDECCTVLDLLEHQQVLFLEVTGVFLRHEVHRDLVGRVLRGGEQTEEVDEVAAPGVVTGCRDRRW